MHWSIVIIMMMIKKCVNCNRKVLQLSNYKSGEQGLNLSRSQQQGHSATYNTPFLYLSRMQRIWIGVDIWTCVRRSPASILLAAGQSRHIMILGMPENMPIGIHSIHDPKLIVVIFSMDSGLEAFSRNPAHGSFSALTSPSTEFANCANQRFLSY